jgi:hypothetical protein
MKKKTLNIGQQIEVLKGTVLPTIGDKPMTIGDLVVQSVPMLSSRDNYMRLWNIGLEVDRAMSEGKETHEVSEFDFEMLKTALMGREQPVWMKVNLERVFAEGE